MNEFITANEKQISHEWKAMIFCFSKYKENIVQNIFFIGGLPNHTSEINQMVFGTMVGQNAALIILPNRYLILIINVMSLEDQTVWINLFFFLFK